MNPNIPEDLELDALSLEDILKEFASEELPEAEEETEIPVLTADTIAMEPIWDVPAVDTLSGDTAVFTPIGSEEPAEEPEPMPPEPEAEEAAPAVPPEPFSEEWEPEYEEPMGEFTPKAPIPFPPKNRLRTLRKKLVAGPEKRYQVLTAQGTAPLRIGIFINFVLAVISVACTVTVSVGSVSEHMLRAMIFGQLLLAMLAALVGCYRLLDGLTGLARGRFTLNASLFVTFIVCIADGLLCLSHQQLPYSCLFCLQMLMSQCAALQRRTTEISQMDILRKATDLTALVKVDDFWQERPGFITKEGEPEDFLEHYRRPSAPEKAVSSYGLLSLLLSFALAVAVGMLQNVNTAVRIFMAAQLISTPFSAFVFASRPAAILQNRIHPLGAVLCGWRGIREVGKEVVFPLHNSDIFPKNATKMNGVKFYGSMDPGRVVSYTTALITAEENDILRVFTLLPRSRDSAGHTVEEFSQHSGGIGGLVDGWPVLVGTAQCMEANGVVLPEGSKVANAIYTAVDGQLSGVFAVTHSRSKSSAAGLRTLCGDGKVSPVVIACDFMLTPRFIREKLSVNPKRLIFPERQVRLDLSRIQSQPEDTVVALMAKEGLAPKAYSLTGARALRTALRAGALIHILGGILGLGAVAVLVFTGGMALLTPINLLLYVALWAIPGLLVTEFTRYI